MKILSKLNIYTFLKIINQYYYTAGINIFLFIFYLSISLYTPYQGDDFIFKINPLEYSIDYKLIVEAVKEPWYWYQNWTGRVVGLYFLTFALLPKKIYFDIINAILQVFLVNIIFFLAKNKIAKTLFDSSYLLIINILLFFGWYAYGGAVFSMTFSIVVVWTHIFTFLYYIVFINYWKYQNSLKKNVLFLVFGVLVGCGFEHVFIGQIFFFIILFFLKSNNKILFLPHYFFYSLFGVLAGGTILIIAPGNYTRAAYSGKNFDFSLDKIIDFWIFELEWLLFYIKPFWIIIIGILIIYSFIYREKVDVKFSPLIILICGFISSLSLSLSPSYHNGINLFFYYCIVIFTISLFDLKKILSAKMMKVVLFLKILLLLIFQGYLMLNQIHIHQYANKLEKEILRKKDAGFKDITVKQINLKTNRFINYMALFNDPEDERNTGIAKYYNIDKIRAIK